MVASVGVAVKHGASAVGRDQDTADLDTPDRRVSVPRRRTSILPPAVRGAPGGDHTHISGRLKCR
jgi:hypothetical protein